MWCACARRCKRCETWGQWSNTSIEQQWKSSALEWKSVFCVNTSFTLVAHLHEVGKDLSSCCSFDQKSNDFRSLQITCSVKRLLNLHQQCHYQLHQDRLIVCFTFKLIWTTKAGFKASFCWFLGYPFSFFLSVVFNCMTSEEGGDYTLAVGCRDTM